ncbi:MAG: hypothetical protein CBC35_08825 [Planctomycetes bacterium TMED75]|nr:hypothetical protein [Planctomycetaceae bacterium]OUU91779.1 MAG: hypothetical protein CBC35_08825 [Planctomycetes bacterium TMED75]
MTAGSRILVALIIIAFITTGLYYLVVTGDDPQPPSIAPAVSEPAPETVSQVAPTPAPTPVAPAPSEPISTEVLAFRVIVPASAPTGVDLERELSTLSVSGPIALPGALAGWYPVHELQSLAPSDAEQAALSADPTSYLKDRYGMVAAPHEGALYVLLYNNGGQSLAPARRRGVDVLSAELAPASPASSPSATSSVEVTLGSDTRERLKMLASRNVSRTWAILVDSTIVEFSRLTPDALQPLSIGVDHAPANLSALRDAIAGSATLAPANFVASQAPSASSGGTVQADSMLLSNTALTATAPASPEPAPPATQAVPVTSRPTGTEYRVASGDTLSSIAQAWFGREQDWPLILKANPDLDPNRLRIGQSIVLPPKTRGASAAPAAPRTESSSASSARPSPGTSYRIRSGDSLSRISQEAYGSAKYWERIYQANRSAIGGDPADLTVGMTLRIPKSPTG